MTYEDLVRIRTMEMLWDDLAHHVQGGAMPAWHAEVLAAREADVAVGTARFDDWETAKQNIVFARERLQWV